MYIDMLSLKQEKKRRIIDILYPAPLQINTIYTIY